MDSRFLCVVPEEQFIPWPVWVFARTDHQEELSPFIGLAKRKAAGNLLAVPLKRATVNLVDTETVGGGQDVVSF